MDLTGKKIGIWGFGVVGTSALNYFLSQGLQVEVLNAQPLAISEMDYLALHNIHFSLQDPDLIPFLDRNDYILPSPGINLQPYHAYQHKWIAELDLFAADYRQPIIALTGTVGKTSITHLLGQLLTASGLNVAVGGNIGIGMLDLLTTPSDIALLEVSSFQLELCTTFAPSVAIWTNFYPNHLDRHGTEDNYFNAKCRIIAHQKSNQHALLPFALYDQISLMPLHATPSYFCTSTPLEHELVALPTTINLYYPHDGMLKVIKKGVSHTIINFAQLPQVSYTENWIIICAALDMLNIPLSVITESTIPLTIPEHRLEKVVTIDSVDFYNDSKSTTPQSTLAAVKQLQGKPLHLFLGGISKGIDRSAMIKQLKESAYHIYCFGGEATMLYELCRENSISSSMHATLHAAVEACTSSMRAGDVVLFSPAGASFDLFTNYAERGTQFKKLVLEYADEINA